MLYSNLITAIILELIFISLKKQYGTKQLNCILNFFIAHGGEHFTARQLIKNKDLNIGEATVYRLLAKLTVTGKLKKFISGDGTGASYQYNDQKQCISHYHLKCLICGDTVCVDCSYINGMDKHVESEHGFLVDNIKTVLYGTCKECRQSI